MDAYERTLVHKNPDLMTLFEPIAPESQENKKDCLSLHCEQEKKHFSRKNF